MLFVFVLVLVAAGWVIVGMQPSGNWFARHVRSWSDDIGIGDVVRALGTWVGALAFGIGASLAAVAEPIGTRREVPAPEPPPEPVPQPDPKPEPEPVGRRERIWDDDDDRTVVK
jgi:hypothetical protein